MTKKGKKRASADVGLMMTAYNLRRLINLIGLEGLREALTASLAAFFGAINDLLGAVKAIFAYFSEMQFVFCSPGKIRGGAHFFGLKTVFERGF